MEDLCRFCAINAADQQIHLFSIKDPNLKEIVEKFFPIKISEADALPKCICKACFAQVLIVKEFFENILNAADSLNAKYEALQREKANRIKQISDKLDRLPISVKKVPVSKSNNNNTNAVSATIATPDDISQVLNRLTGVTVKKTKISLESNVVDSTPIISVVSEEIIVPRRTSSRNKPVIYSEDFKTDSDEEYKPPSLPRTPRSTPKKRKLSTNGKSPNTKPIIKMVLDNGPAYVCTTCKSRFDSFDKLKMHMAESQKCKDANVTCQICGKLCNSRKALYAHSITHKEKTAITCDICSKVFANKFNLENHMVSHHGQTEDTNSVFRCRLCEKQFMWRKELIVHMEEHQKEKTEGERLCETCGKSFSSVNALKNHMRSHATHNFKCNDCDKTFRSQVQLTQHSHVHTGVKAFSCGKCDKSYAKKSSLSLHEKSHYVELKEHSHETPSPTRKVYVVPETRTIDEAVIFQPTSGTPSSYTLSFQNF